MQTRAKTYHASEWIQAIPAKDKIVNRTKSWEDTLNKYSIVNDADNSEFLHDDDFAPILEESDENDSSSDEELGKFMGESRNKQLMLCENKADYFDVEEVKECLRPQIIRLEKLLPQDVVLYNQPCFSNSNEGRQNQNNQPDFDAHDLLNSRKFRLSSNYESSNTFENAKNKQSNHVRSNHQLKVDNNTPPNWRQKRNDYDRRRHYYSDSDSSMCSMEEANYIRQNMGKRKPNNNRYHKTICKKTIIKEYRIVSSVNHDGLRSPPTYRPAMPTLSSPQKKTRGRPCKILYSPPKPLMSLSEVDGSSSSSSIGRDQQKRHKPIQKHKPPASLDLSDSSMDLFLLPKSKDNKNCLKYKTQKTVPPDLSKNSTRLWKSKNDKYNLKDVSVICKPLNLIDRNINLNQILNIGKDKKASLIAVPTRQPTLVTMMAPQTRNGGRKPVERITQMKPPKSVAVTSKRVAKHKTSKSKATSKIESIVISSDSESCVGATSRKIRRFNESTNKDSGIQSSSSSCQNNDISEPEMLQIPVSCAGSQIRKSQRFNETEKKVSETRDKNAGNQYNENSCPNSNEPEEPKNNGTIVVYQGNRNAKATETAKIDKSVLERALGSELTYQLIGVKNYVREIATSTTVYFVPPPPGSQRSRENNSDYDSDEDARVPNFGKLVYDELE